MGCTTSSVSSDTMYLGDDKARTYTKRHDQKTNGKAIRCEETETEEIENKTEDEETAESPQIETESRPRGLNMYAPDPRTGDVSGQESQITDPRSPIDKDKEFKLPPFQGLTEKEKRIFILTKRLQSRVNNVCDNDLHYSLDFHSIRSTANVVKTYYNVCGLKSHFDTKKQEGLMKERNKRKQEKIQLLNRMSELASAALKFNNPAIADLSDSNRATKLVERTSELYDNEWTDIFEIAREKLPPDTADRQIVECLRNILQFCYQICEKRATAQRVSMHQVLRSAGAMDDQNTMLRIKELQKKAADSSLHRVSECAKQEMSQKHRLKHKPLFSPVLDVLTVTTSPLRDYIERCVNVCWYMHTQDPQVVMQFDAGTDISLFRQYTQSGPIFDYVVWPVIFLLHRGGPLLYRGVAQFKHEENCTCKTHIKVKAPESKSEQTETVDTGEKVAAKQEVGEDTVMVENETDATVSDLKHNKDNEASYQSNTLAESPEIDEDTQRERPKHNTGNVAAEFKLLGKRRRKSNELSSKSSW